VLQTLADRLSAGEARDLAAELPPEIAPWMATTTAAQPFGLDGFLQRVAEREGIDLDAAERHTRAVFTALGRAVRRQELEDMAAELPNEFASLLGDAEGRFAGVQPLERILQRIADRAGTDAETARRAADAVLVTLGERIDAGEVADLIARLPAELHAPLRTGVEASGGKATRMALDEFVRRVAEREGVAPDVAFEHTRAVMVTLREAVGEDEFLDLSAQLPSEYAAVGAKP
jgi:uncharacterized protein (DUF2267 family)